MSKITLASVKPAVGNVSGLCLADTRIVDYVNRSIERLMAEGNWVGTTQRMRIQASDGQITWPREVETVLGFAACKMPGQVRNEWYEYLEGGPGIQSTTSCLGDQLIDRGQAVAFNDVIGQSKLAVIPDKPASEATTSYIRLRFLNLQSEMVRSQLPSGTWIDGEQFTLTGSHTTVNFCAPGGLIEVIKSVTVGTIRLYEVTSSGALRPLAYYAPDETVPLYRRSLVPGLANNTNTSLTFTVQVKKRYLPVSNDEDVLLIQSVEAIRLGVQAILKEEKDLLTEGAAYWAQAIRLLQKQLENYIGAGTSIPIRMSPIGAFGAGFVGEMH